MFKTLLLYFHRLYSRKSRNVAVTEEEPLLLTSCTLMGNFSTGGSGLGLCVHIVSAPCSVRIAERKLEVATQRYVPLGVYVTVLQ